ncbi:MAG: hypothetical protein IK051_11300 [Rhodocyclaceae bacterium]|nr:hypothetical protein [Rhodocyclaceae bacterium]MBR4738232.1 hypothetical protein [Rhodocyclaceae bacterium]
MNARLIYKQRQYIDERRFAEIVIWQVSVPVAPSVHPYKYRLAYVADGQCVLRFDNERGKGDHYHLHGQEVPYRFSTLDALLDDFWSLVAKTEASKLWIQPS